MAAEEPIFAVSQIAAVTRRIRALGKLARHLGIENEFLADLTTIAVKLQTEPVAWGEPEYHPKKEGSVVCHGIAGALFVQFAVFEPERKVTILRVKPLPGSPLSS